ncbi:MAG: Uma2 family endonuclease [Verrucomicrobiaceae bacterium]|nr:Uma2 family endonuclease [Verrucomicrobiaceae bacterium]
MIASNPETEPAYVWDEEAVPRPDVSNLITEDDTPVDSIFEEKQTRLLISSLYDTWGVDFPFVAMSRVGVFTALNRPAVVPDVLLTTGVRSPKDIMQKESGSYFSWLYDGKPPEEVIEIVSNKKGNELGSKKRNYEHMGVTWYAVYDPMTLLSDEPLQLFALEQSKYRKQPADRLLGEVGLGLAIWEGEFEGTICHWLRWKMADGKLVQTGKERGDAEAARAQTEAARADKLAEKLRELGIDPASLD